MKNKRKKMVKKTQPGKDKQLATAFLLSYPQLFVWAFIFALIGGITVWSSNALSNKDQGATGSIALRMVTDNNHDGQPNWGDSIAFDVSTSAAHPTTLRLSCYQNGENVYFAQRFYGTGSSTRLSIDLKSTPWQSGASDCVASLLNSTSSNDKVLSTYNFHVNP